MWDAREGGCPVGVDVLPVVVSELKQAPGSLLVDVLRVRLTEVLVFLLVRIPSLLREGAHVLVGVEGVLVALGGAAGGVGGAPWHDGLQQRRRRAGWAGLVAGAAVVDGEGASVQARHAQHAPAV